MIHSTYGHQRPTAIDGAPRQLCIFWVMVAINVSSFVSMLTWLARKAGRIRLADGSGGCAAIEMREALDI